jgi:hypothetical protein
MVEVNKHTGERNYLTTQEFIMRLHALDLDEKRALTAITGDSKYYESDHAWFLTA